MQKLLREYLDELNRKQKRRRKTVIAVVLAAIMLVSGVIWNLTQYGIAMTDEPKCGMEEHTHSDSCYADVLTCGREESAGHTHTETCYQTTSELVCGQEESEEHTHSEACYQTVSELICGQEESEGHTHTDACYEKQLSCGKEEHTHSEACYIDTTADVEDASIWNAQYADTKWKEGWGENLVIAAGKQIGYQESEKNYTIAEDGSHKGYTRYGQYAVNAGMENADVYADWDTTFVNFCLHYAGLSETNIFPAKTDAIEWYEEFGKINEKINEYLSCLVAPEGYEPKAGDIVIFQKGREEEEKEYQMGIVSSYDKEKDELKVIEGNSKNEVKENDYNIEAKAGQDDKVAPVFCYVDMSRLEKTYKGTDEAEQDPADTEDPDEKTEEEETIELTTEVDDMMITLYGPESSFEAGKEYTIQAEKVENEEVLATVEEAVEQMAEEKEKKVENFQPYDIKLMLDGEEVQPLGPVAVKFSGKEVEKSVEDEATEVSVLHVDENTGEATDMEATPTEEKEVVIETEHFSVYVYVELGNQAVGGIKINIQHWGEKIRTVDGNFKSMNANTPEYGFDVATGKVKMTGEKKDGTYNEEQRKYQLYATDKDYSLPHETYVDIRSLSKVYNVTDTGYKISKVWVSKGGTADRDKYKETEKAWPKDEYTEYTYQQLQDQKTVTDLNRLPDGCTIRFWYEPVKGTWKDKNGVSFYDYTIGTGDALTGSSGGDRKGINKDVNFREGGNDKSPRLGVGQKSFGNRSSWVDDKYKGKNLNAGNRVGKCDYAFTGLVKDQLVNGAPVFVDGIDAPENLFTNNPNNGSRLFNNYQLEFSREGDTYTLSDVYRSGKKVETASNLTKFYKMAKYTGSGVPVGSNGYVFSNKFWPLDGAEHQLDPKGKGDFDETHNWYFGMAYKIDFDTTDYTGPLQYYFRGDDDFWLFVDGKLAVDLGGIHSALGTSFDLKPFIKNSKTNKHTLSVYYMERGATGSTCYMQFTLPRVQMSSLTPQPTTSCTVKKVWDDADSIFRPKSIKVTLYKEKEGEDKVPVREITLPTADGKWECTVDDLPVYDGKNNKKISYTADEVLVDDNPMWDYDVKVDKDEGTDKILVTISNNLKLHKIKVEKLWEDDKNEVFNRPDNVTFRLLYREHTTGELMPYRDKNNKERTITLNADGNWKGEFTKIPKSYYNSDTKTWEEVEYWIEEISNSVIKDEYNGKHGAIYQVGETTRIPLTPEDEDNKYIDSFSITNTLLTKNVCLEKISKSSGTPGLSGAVFNLYTEDAFENGELKEDAKPYRPSIVTGDQGLVNIQGLRFGTYYLVEIQAPIHYTLLEKPIKIVSSSKGVDVDFQIDGWGKEHVKYIEAKGKYIITIPNEIMYELPSTGGPGIYGYICSGILLMAGAVLMTYKKRRKEVLRS